MHILKESIKYKGQYFKRGDSIKIDREHIDGFKSKGYIDMPYTKPKEDKIVIEEENKEVPEEEEVIDYTQFTVDEIKVILDNEGIKYTSSDNKADLIDKLR